ncbi:hypothetical protein FQN49_004483 [Arthroderma sp. PD_2]|nr:hypothetical protein FQN49_004483 [Arthroderma sp. PD_2]
MALVDAGRSCRAPKPACRAPNADAPPTTPFRGTSATTSLHHKVTSAPQKRRHFQPLDVHKPYHRGRLKTRRTLPSSASRAVVPPPPGPFSQGRVHEHPQRPYEQQPPLLPLFKYTRKSPSSTLWNPVNYLPRSTSRSSQPQSPRTVLTGDSRPKRDAYPLLTLPERRRIRSQESSAQSVAVKRSIDEPEAVGRTSIGLPRKHRRGDTWGNIEMVDHPEGLTGQRNDLRAPEPAFAIRNGNPFSMNGSTAAQQHPDDPPETPRHVNSQHSFRPQTFVSVPPINPNNPSSNPQVPSGPANLDMHTHVSLNSEEYVHTRVIRIRRDWMVKGDLAPTFSNLYPEILDPLLGEQEFRTIITKINDELITAFDPCSSRNWLDGIIGFLTGWIWDDLGASRVKSRVKGLEAWIDNWNNEVGAPEGVKIWGPRRTGFLSLDIQIPDPKIGIVESDGGSDLGTRPSTANTRLAGQQQM